MSSHEILNPESLGRPRGYSNGILAARGRALFIAGQIGWNSAQQLVSPEFAPQFAQALKNVLTVLAEAGGKPEHVVRFTIYVTDKQPYIAASSQIGASYRELMGRHYPAMTLVQVAALLEPGAQVEIEATAVIPEEAR
jgi:enamine deaminase RidA (YjgF/YER057c/UK114 family)